MVGLARDVGLRTQAGDMFSVSGPNCIDGTVKRVGAWGLACDACAPAWAPIGPAGCFTIVNTLPGCTIVTTLSKTGCNVQCREPGGWCTIAINPMQVAP